MKAARKQQLLIAFGIFSALSAISFSFQHHEVGWFWQRAPYVAVFLMVIAFVTIRLWVKLEVSRQKQIIIGAVQIPNVSSENNLYQLLSPREKEVIQLVVDGKTNHEIAAALFISLSTVKTHINNIYKILEVKNRREAIERTKS